MKMSDLQASKRNNTKKNSRERCDMEHYRQLLSKKQIDIAEKLHNRKVKKLMRENFGIPVVYGGMGTF